MRSDGRIVGRRRRAVVVVNQSSFETRHISNISGGGGARFFTNSLPTYVWKQSGGRKIERGRTLPDGRIVTMRSRRTGSRSIRALPPTLPPAIST